MRKANLSLIVTCLIGTFVFFNSCKREFSPDTSSNNATISKVNAWLDEQKQGKLPNKAAKLDLLRTNLNFSNLHFEKSDNGEQFLIVPINEKFKATNGIDKNSIVNLFLVINTSGDIRSGNVVLYTAATGQVNKIPENTFYNIFNTAQPDCNGKFQFLTVTGAPQYQLEYKDKHLISSGLYQSKENSAKSSIMAPVCYDVYLVTTYYGQDGTVVAQTSQFLFTTCSDDTSGGGGGETVNCCISDPTAQLISRAVSETRTDNCGSESTDQVTGSTTRICTHIWVFNRSSLLFYSWQYSSIEKVVEEKVGGVWRFKSMPSHSGMNTSGSIPPCVSTNVLITAAIPWLSTDKSAVSMDLYYTQNFSILCIPQVSGGLKNHNDHAKSQWFCYMI